MRVAIGSMFRNSTPYLPRYFRQIEALALHLTNRGDSLELILVEGDSTDKTFNELDWRSRAYPRTLIQRAHGGKHAWHSVDIPQRWAAISWVCNELFDQILPHVDAMIYVEADLTWAAVDMVRMLDQLDSQHPAISPMCFSTGPAGEFYDLWGYFKDGVGFGPFPPYHHALGPGLTVIDSAGSCFVMLGEVARKARFHQADHVRGFGRSIRQHGYSLWCDPTSKVLHG